MGLLDRFVSRFARGNAAPATTPTSIVQVQSIIQAYSRVLERSAPGAVADASGLPYPKETIEYAILFALRVADDEDLRSYLRQAFLDLSRWQDGVGRGGRRSGLRASATTPGGAAASSEPDPWAAVMQTDLDRLTRKLQESGFAA